MATHSSTLAWKIPWTEKPGRLQSMGSLRVGHDWATSLSPFTFMHWRRKWQPTPVFLPGESQGRGAWWAAIYGVTQSRTWLKRLSSSSSICIYLCMYLCILEKEMATHSSILAWRIPWTEEPGRLQSMGSLRVGHDWATKRSTSVYIHIYVHINTYMLYRYVFLAETALMTVELCVWDFTMINKKLYCFLTRLWRKL